MPEPHATYASSIHASPESYSRPARHEEQEIDAGDEDENSQADASYSAESATESNTEDEPQANFVNSDFAAPPPEAEDAPSALAKRSAGVGERLRALKISRKMLMTAGSVIGMLLLLGLVGGLLYRGGRFPFRSTLPYANLHTEFEREWNERLPQLMKDQKATDWASIPVEYRDQFAADVARRVNVQAKQVAPPVRLDVSAADVLSKAETASVTLQPSWGAPQETPSAYSWNLHMTVRITAKKPVLRNDQSFHVTAYDSEGKPIDDTSAGQATDLSPGEAGTLEFRVPGYTAGNVKFFKIFCHTI